jgi:hypothetical protein
MLCVGYGDCKVAFSGGMWRGFAAPEGKCIGFWRHSRQKPIHFFRFQSEALDFAVALVRWGIGAAQPRQAGN